MRERRGVAARMVADIPEGWTRGHMKDNIEVAVRLRRSDRHAGKAA